MNKTKLINMIYYSLKPLIPRRGQIWLRRKVVNLKRKACADVWPIDEKAARLPQGWSGWPDQKRFALVLTHDVESAKGYARSQKLAELEEYLGFRSSFNLLTSCYEVSSEFRQSLVNKGFEIGIHGLTHDGKLFHSEKLFKKQAALINKYLNEWGSVGFRAPSMRKKLEWIHDLDIIYDSSTFDTDPFEPQPEGVGTIFPFWVTGNCAQKGYVELPYTLPQDFTLFVLMKEKTVDIWKKKLDWIAQHGGMALLITHPDYMNFDGKKIGIDEYQAEYYKEFLEYIKSKYEDQYWHVLPEEIVNFQRQNFAR